MYQFTKFTKQFAKKKATKNGKIMISAKLTSENV